MKDSQIGLTFSFLKIIHLLASFSMTMSLQRLPIEVFLNEMCDFLQYSWTCPDLKSFKTTESSFIIFFIDYEYSFLFNHIQPLFDFWKIILDRKTKNKIDVR